MRGKVLCNVTPLPIFPKAIIRIALEVCVSNDSSLALFFSKTLIKCKYKFT